MPRPARSPRRCSRSGRRRHVPRVHGIRAPGGVGSSTRPRARAHDRRPRNSRIGRLLTTRRVGLPTAAAGRTTNGRSAYCYRAGRPPGPGVDAAAQPPARPSCGGAPGPAHDVLAVGENRTLWRLDVAVPQVCCRRTRRARITRSEQRHAQHASQPARWGPSTAPAPQWRDSSAVARSAACSDVLASVECASNLSAPGAIGRGDCGAELSG
jgi:hypothetical protein